MGGTTGTTNIKVAQTGEDFAYWLSRPYLSTLTRESLLGSNVLLVPFETYQNAAGPVFSSETRALLGFLETQSASGIRVGIAIDEEQFHEVLLHGRLLTLGKVVLAFGVVPLTVNLLSNFVQKQIDKGGQNTVRVELIVVQTDGAATSLKYDGPAEQFDSTIRSAVSSIVASRAENVMLQGKQDRQAPPKEKKLGVARDASLLERIRRPRANWRLQVLSLTNEYRSKMT